MKSTQDRIADLLETFEMGAADTGEPADGAPMTMVGKPPTSDSQASGMEDNQVTTHINSCCATGCAHNINGERCGLTKIEVNERGGCSNYEAETDDFDDEYEQEVNMIDGISNAMPEQPDFPTAMSNMAGRFNPGAML